MQREIQLAKSFVDQGRELAQDWLREPTALTRKRMLRWHQRLENEQTRLQQEAFFSPGVWYEDDDNQFPTSALFAYSIRLHAVGLSARAVALGCPKAIKPLDYVARKMSDDDIMSEDVQEQNEAAQNALYHCSVKRDR